MKSKKAKIFIIALAAFSVVLSLIIVLMTLSVSFKRNGGSALKGLISEKVYFSDEAAYIGYLSENGIKAEKSDKRFVSAAVQKIAEQTRKDKIYFLYLELTVTFDTAASVYQIDVAARWDKKSSYAGSITAEGTALDFLAITWGGAGGLCAKDHSMYGRYYGSDKTEAFSKRESNSYGGFVWQFSERNGLYGAILQEARASVTLEPAEGNIIVREAGVRLTYIHTAHRTNYGLMTVDYGRGDSSAPRILYETVGDSFKTELCIEDLIF